MSQAACVQVDSQWKSQVGVVGSDREVVECACIALGGLPSLTPHSGGCYYVLFTYTHWRRHWGPWEMCETYHPLTSCQQHVFKTAQDCIQKNTKDTCYCNFVKDTSLMIR